MLVVAWLTIEYFDSAFLKTLDLWTVLPIFVEQFVLVVSQSDLKGPPKFISHHRERLERPTFCIIQSLGCCYHTLIYNRCRIDLRCGRHLGLELSVYGLLTAAWIVVTFLSSASTFSSALAFSLLLLQVCLLLLGKSGRWCSCWCLFLLTTWL